jgi:cyclopropane-fatty-acyl-phospholipid synthase
MAKTTGVAPKLAKALGIVLGTRDLGTGESGTEQIPVRLRAWDGSEAGPEDAPLIEFTSRRALRRILWSPGQLGLSRAYVAGEITAHGDIFAAFAALSSAGKFAQPGPFSKPTASEVWTLVKTGVRLGALGAQPRSPAGGSEGGKAREAALEATGRSRHLTPLRRRQRLLPVGARPVDGLLVRCLVR